LISVLDIDLLAAAIRSGGTDEFDITGDGSVDDSDFEFWVSTIARTYRGDANLDGEFNSNDLIEVFAAGEYEDNVSLNSLWADGDWDGDGDFTTSDIVSAFGDGGYEQGARAAASAVPEPTSFVLLIAGLFAIASNLRAQVVEQRSR
jgi:hypothetical protein